MPLIPPSCETPFWFCVKTQPRRERAAYKTLLTLPEVEAILPMARYPKQNSKGKRMTSEAIFPGYLFCRFSPVNSSRAVQYSQGVAYIIKRGDKLVSLRDELIEEIRELAPEGVLELEPKPLMPGERVRLIQGIFSGSEAEVVGLAPSAERVKVLLEILGREQEITLPLEEIERMFENPFSD
ncbi:transcription termination/antitermination protein NusG [Cerasicoccus fimbriatus]|uniref:transcription termination/antitermination protein NusG n=1 Tax=Cerasicoccus fimbriatus TaxID=3014554 RepID=UPI0022B4065C|nr:transcription termination/antitermination NusG family protein [Cerasicoccus sp. TK19100]